VLTEGCTSSQSYKIKTGPIEALRIIPRINREFVLVNFTNVESWGKIMLSKYGRRKEKRN